MSNRILAWSIICAFLGLSVWSDWPADPWGRVYQVAGLAIAAATIGLFIAAFIHAHVIPLLHRIDREGFGPVVRVGTKVVALVVAACFGLIALILAAMLAIAHLHWSVAVFGLPLLYVIVLAQIVRWIDRRRKRDATPASER